METGSPREGEDGASCQLAQSPPAVPSPLPMAGLRVREKDEHKLARWLQERSRARQLDSIAAYEQLLAADSPEGRREREALTAYFSTGETYFFRDRGVFSLLADNILPELIGRRTARRSLRLWSAGCASGEEAYSLAMLLDELAPQLTGWEVAVFASDINTHALDSARNGVYSQWSFRSLDETRKARYFQPCPRGWKIDARLQKLVTFAPLDLVHDHFPASGIDGFDLILCRNVFIYLAPSAVAQIAGKLADALADGGYLITGHGELIGCSTPGLRSHLLAESVVLRKETPSAPSGAPGKAPAMAFPAPSPPVQARRPTVAGPRASSPRVAAAAKSATTSPRPRVADLETELQAAWQAANRGASDAATAACRRAIASTPCDPRPYYLLAQLAQDGGILDEARTLLNKVLYLDPSCVAAYLDLAALHARAGDTAGSRRMRQRARKLLAALPPETRLAMPRDTTAGELLQSVDRLLEPSAGAPQSPPTSPATRNDRPPRG